MKCEWVRRYGAAYVDGEVSAETALELERHLDGCAPCLTEVDMLAAMKAEVKRVGVDVVAPAALKANLQVQLDGWVQEADQEDGGEPELVRPSGVGVSPAGWVAQGQWVSALGVGSVLVALAVLGVVAQSRGSGWLGSATAAAEPVFEDVVRVHAAELPADVAGEEHVTRFFRHHVAFPVRPARFRDEKARLVGARVSNVRENRAAALYYEVGGRRVTVVVFDGHDDAVTAGSMRAQRDGQELVYHQVHGYTVPVRTQNGLHYAFAGEMDPESLLQLAATAQVSY